MDNNNISSDYIGSMYDDVIDGPILKNKLSVFLELKKRRFGRFRNFTIPIRSRFKIIRSQIIDQNRPSQFIIAIYALFEKDSVLSTSGISFPISFNIKCLVVVFDVPRGLLPCHTADNNLAGILLLGISRIVI